MNPEYEVWIDVLSRPLKPYQAFGAWYILHHESSLYPGGYIADLKISNHADARFRH